MTNHVYRDQAPSVCDDSALKLVEYRLKWVDKQIEYQEDQARAQLRKAHDHRAKADELIAERPTWIEAIIKLGGTPPEETLLPTHCQLGGLEPHGCKGICTKINGDEIMDPRCFR
jgi:hypothetical protein